MTTESKKRTEKVCQVGDLIRIPIADNSFVAAHVLYISKRMKDIFLLGVIGLNVEADSLISYPEYSELVWSGMASLKDGQWSVVGTAPISQSEEYTRSIVGGWICVEEEEIRPAKKQDYETIPRMMPYPRIALENFLNKRFLSSRL